MKKTMTTIAAYSVSSICIVASYVQFALAHSAMAGAITLTLGVLGMCVAVATSPEDEFCDAAPTVF